jgi:EAL domain-containing protein (putative c-di-GMP-specific phosphodiesterase class I)/CheY-like chemotaxis protein
MRSELASTCQAIAELAVSDPKSGHAFAMPDKDKGLAHHVKTKVLIIDDEPAVLRYIQRALRVAGFEAISVETGAAGIVLARSAHPDLIVCDINMPGIDGHGVLSALRGDAATCDMPFIFLTGLGDQADVRNGMRLGADDYIAKPFLMSELVDAVRSRLARRRQITDVFQQQVSTMTERLTSLMQSGVGQQMRAAPSGMLDRQQFERVVERLSVTCSIALPTLPVAILRITDSDKIYGKLGHAAGEELQHAIEQRLLVEVAARPLLMAVGHLGVQRFGLVFLAGTDGMLAMSQLQDLADAMRQLYQLQGREIFVQFIIGMTYGAIASVSSETDAPAPAKAGDLLLQAEAATKLAMSRAFSGLQVFQGALPVDLADKFQLEVDLYHAVERNQLHLVYQPQVSLLTDDVFGFEALVRWQHPQFGLVSPANFIELAEQNGTIVGIGEWVLRTACTQMATWLAQQRPFQRVAVNVSAIQIQQADFAAMVQSCLQKAGLDAKHLQLELTESSVLSDLPRACQLIEDLHAIGVSVAIDDFGVGFSSLSYLLQLKFDELKIDRSFIRNMEQEPDKIAIVDMILGLAERLGFEVTAEGIETMSTRNLLSQRRCRLGQGYFFARPLTVLAIESALQLASTKLVQDGKVVLQPPSAQLSARTLALAVSPRPVALRAQSIADQKMQRYLFA